MTLFVYLKSWKQAMVWLTFSADEIKAAPPEVRRWFGQEMARMFRSSHMPEPSMGTVMPSGRGVTEAHESTEAESAMKAGTRKCWTGEPAREAEIRHLVAQRAYELWENQGRPHGHDVTHWHQAEQEIMNCVRDPSTDHRQATRSAC